MRVSADAATSVHLNMEVVTPYDHKVPQGALPPLTSTTVQMPSVSSRKNGDYLIVDLAVNVDNILHIDCIERTFVVDFVVMMHWDEVAAGKHWEPSVVIKNAIEDVGGDLTSGDAVRSGARAAGSGRMKRTQRFLYKLSTPCQDELKSFPFDWLSLDVDIHLRGAARTIEYQGKEKWPACQPKLVLQREGQRECKIQVREDESEFDVLSTFDIFDVGHDVAKGGTAGISKIKLRMYAVRRAKVYLWDICAILLFIESLVFCVAAIPNTDLSDRIGVVVTLMLAATAFKYVVQESRPKLAFQTLLDKFVMSSFVTLYCVTIGCVVVVIIGRNIEAESAELVDRGMFGMVFLFWVMRQVYFLYHAMTLYGKQQNRVGKGDHITPAKKEKKEMTKIPRTETL